MIKKYMFYVVIASLMLISILGNVFISYILGGIIARNFEKVLCFMIITPCIIEGLRK